MSSFALVRSVRRPVAIAFDEGAVEDVDQRPELFALGLTHRVAHERFACALVATAGKHFGTTPTFERAWRR